MYPNFTLFAEIDWGQSFIWGLVGGGAALTVTGLMQIIRAVNADYREKDQVTASQSMMLGHIILGIILVCGGLFLRGRLTEPTPEVALADFIEYHSKDGHFTASFPREPQEVTRSYMTFKFKIIGVEEKEGFYEVTYFDIPRSIKLTPSMTKRMLDNGRNGMLQMAQAKLKSESQITLEKKYPGREVRAEVPRGNHEIYCSMYLVDNRVYIVAIKGKKEWLKSDRARKFLNSFALR